MARRWRIAVFLPLRGPATGKNPRRWGNVGQGRSSCEPVTPLISSGDESA